MKFTVYQNEKVKYQHKIIGSTMVKMSDGTYRKEITLDVTENENDRYEVIAKLERGSKGNMIHHINQNIDIPKKYRETDGFCECCGQNRYRHNLYLVADKTDGTIHQVGSSCIRKYTGDIDEADVERTMKILEGYKEYNRSAFQRYYDLKEIVSIAKAHIDMFGYKSSRDLAPTKEDVMKTWKDEKAEILGYSSIEKLYKALFDEVDKVIDYWRNEVDDNSDFNHNMKLVASEDYVAANHIGFATYLYQGYRKEMDRREKLRRIEEENKSIDFFGEIKKRYKNLIVDTVRVITSWESSYGYNNTVAIYEIKLKGINSIFTWKTQSIVDEGDEISFTVKDHKVYNGVKQTEITRVRAA